MSEFMGNIYGKYEAKESSFPPGASSLHQMMTAHGPEAQVYKNASTAELKPVKMMNTLSFMLESAYMLTIS